MAAFTRVMPTRALDTATLSFGLVAIPVKIYTTSEPSHELHFNLIHEGCGERLKQRYVCPKHGEVERADMAKGFEITKGNFVELEKSELKALEAVATDSISPSSCPRVRSIHSTSIAPTTSGPARAASVPIDCSATPSPLPS